MKKGQFIKIVAISSLKQIHKVEDDVVEYWSGGNLLKIDKRLIESVYSLDTIHLEEIKE